MPHYMIQFSYTPETWAKLSKNPENRAETIKVLIEKLGGRLTAFYFAFGEYDGMLTLEVPDANTAAVTAIIATAAGHLKAIKTTPLVTAEEGLEIMRKAGSLPLQIPRG